MIVTTSTSHDFLPHTWSSYSPSWVELTITLGSFGFFFAAFLIFTKVLPVMPIADLKTLHVEELGEEEDAGGPDPGVVQAEQGQPGVLAVYDSATALNRAVRAVREAGFFRLEIFSPTRPNALLEDLGRNSSTVSFWTLAGALFGMAAGFGLAAYAASVNSLIVGGKPPIAVLPYLIPTFEFAILFGTIGNLTGLVRNAGLTGRATAPRYDRRFSRDKYGLLLDCSGADQKKARAVLNKTKPEEVDVFA